MNIEGDDDEEADYGVFGERSLKKFNIYEPLESTEERDKRIKQHRKWKEKNKPPSCADILLFEMYKNKAR